MVTIQEAKENIGRKVIYLVGTDRQEEGVISSVNDRCIFVRYGGSCTGQGTRQEDLTFL